MVDFNYLHLNLVRSPGFLVAINGCRKTFHLHAGWMVGSKVRRFPNKTEISLGKGGIIEKHQGKLENPTRKKHGEIIKNFIVFNPYSFKTPSLATGISSRYTLWS